MVSMLRSTFALDLQTFLISVSILCFCTSLVEVKWIAGCSIEHTLTPDLYLEHQLIAITLCTVSITAAAPPTTILSPAQTETTSQPSLSLCEAARKWAV